MVKNKKPLISVVFKDRQLNFYTSEQWEVLLNLWSVGGKPTEYPQLYFKAMPGVGKWKIVNSWKIKKAAQNPVTLK